MAQPGMTVNALAIAQQQANNTSASVSGTEGELIATRLAKSPRRSFTITPLTAGVTVYVIYGEGPAVLNTGYALNSGQALIESATDVESAMQVVWQGPIRAIASGAGTVAIQQTFFEQNP